MLHQSDSRGPLARGWNEWRGELSDHGYNGIEIEILRKMFMAGAHIACQAAARNPLAILLMLREVREYNDNPVRGDA